MKLNKKLLALGTAVTAALPMSIVAFAAEEGETGGTTTGTSAIQSAVSTALEGVSGDVMTTIGDVLPYALAIVGAGLVVVLGVKYFKKIAGK